MYKVVASLCHPTGACVNRVPRQVTSTSGSLSPPLGTHLRPAVSSVRMCVCRGCMHIQYLQVRSSSFPRTSPLPYLTFPYLPLLTLLRGAWDAWDACVLTSYLQGCQFFAPSCLPPVGRFPVRVPSPLPSRLGPVPVRPKTSRPCRSTLARGGRDGDGQRENRFIVAFGLELWHRESSFQNKKRKGRIEFEQYFIESRLKPEGFDFGLPYST
ncbi:hypothetical protein BZA05DRAFT_217406 [Tricharina praecox]|uniref:uncharacterized protein n=1 Tax=Tricharina praecox TaxID=43433 RepID=UPI0022208B94|nr:uncharacterized protein BZA05DRAFT_217406 [Tricharina praecox]KAI5855775.1 hypothetical protein BZA05DRAFT_217406 [Tricharina praecox]